MRVDNRPGSVELARTSASPRSKMISIQAADSTEAVRPRAAHAVLRCALCYVFFFSFFPAACRRLDDRSTACASIICGCFFPQMHQSHCIRSNPPTCPSGVGIKAAGIHHPTHTHAITPTAPRCLARTAVLNLERHAWLAIGKSNSKAQKPNV